MKKFIFTFAVVLCVLLLSCNSSNSKSTSNSEITYSSKSCITLDNIEDCGAEIKSHKFNNGVGKTTFGLFAFECTTDTTEDLTVKVERPGVTELSLSLEASRTHLGEKADGLYPLYWSEGDAISVNGVASSELIIGSDPATAVFKFAEEVTTPLCVIYPAQEGTGEGTTYPVNFLAEQAYTVGTFAPQAAPMYGYAAEEGVVSMQHLTGVLRLAIAGNGEKVTSIVVKAQNGKIAGAFTVDCTNGTLTAVEGTNTVNVTFAEPLVLGTEATPVYLTVPAGQYGTFVITIVTEAHEKMTVKFDSDIRPINAGNVREFSEFTYEAN